MVDQTDLHHSRSSKHGLENTDVIDLREYKKSKNPLPVTFHRRELDAILWIYGRMVGEGEWRDYAIDHNRDVAVFSVFKRSGEMPLYQVIKNPKLANKQGAFSVVNTHGTVLKRGSDLKQVLKVFDKALKLVET